MSEQQISSKVASLEMYENILSPITLVHLDFCNCQKERLREIEKEEYNKELLELRTEDLMKDVTVRDSRLNRSLERARLILVGDCQKANIRCSVEKQIIQKELQMFVNYEKYKLDDPRAYIIIESLMNLKLSEHRLSLHTTNYGSVQSVFDREGNETFKLNPAEEYKMKYNNSRIAAIKELNLIFEGAKSTVVTIDANKIIDARVLFGEHDTTQTELLREIK